MSEYVEKELIFKIHRLKDEFGDWNPAIEDVGSHEIDPTWVAGMMYVILDRYLSCIEDSKQEEFFTETMIWFETMLQKGGEYVDKIKDDF